MAFSSHKGTTGHTIGASIIGKDKPSSGSPDPAHTAIGFSHLSVTPAANGISVSHTPKQDKTAEVGHAETPVEEQLHVFRSATEAHNHIGQLLGVRIGSGAQTT